MNFRFGITLLVVALVFAIGQVNSEETNAETMVRRDALERMEKRSPDPINAAAVIAAIKKRLGRSAESMSMDRARRNPDPSILDVITDAVNSAMNAMG